MKFKKLGTTNIDVSLICLGTMTWGEQNSLEEAHQQLDYALDRGVNFIDTAEMYPVPPTAETYTKTEQIIGKWNKLQTQRDKIILATKVVGPMGSDYVRGGNQRLNREHIVKAVDASLKRLNVDYIDLYQLHWPERKTNYFGQRGYLFSDSSETTPIEETLRALDEVQKAGKVRHFGLSNETPWGTMNFLQKAKENNLPQVASIQNPYNLLNRSYEIAMAEISMQESCGLLAYSPMAFGVLSGKYRNQAKPKGARLTKWERFSRYTSPNAIQATEHYCHLAEQYDLSPAQMALSYVNSREFVTSNIIGATNMDQLKENIDSINIELSDELLSQLELIHEAYPNPCP